ncbi:MAG: glycosyltransferase family 2 protein, partial [Proteobacteria bacterium]|nr:glycosyltransferase family 2 protein [Pseudomonadota bacterium]
PEEPRISVQEVRDYLETVTGFKSVTVIKRAKNLGLAQSIIDGVAQLCNQHGRVIVVEDDLVTSPYFLCYMNEALDLYQLDDRVISIHGYMYPVLGELPETFFMRGADCWGWGTWKRGWDLFEYDGEKLLAELDQRNLRRKFDLNGAYEYSKMLEDQISGKNNSWAIRWHASAFLKNKLTLYPSRSLVCNIGFDGSGTHCGSTSSYDADLAQSPILVKKIVVEENLVATQLIESYWRSINPPWMKRITRNILNWLN